jgi:hypothetical protein
MIPPSHIESAYFVSLMFYVLDNNIRNFKCVLSGAGFSAQEMAKSLEWHHPDMGPDNPARGRLIRPPPPLRGIEKWLRT